MRVLEEAAKALNRNGVSQTSLSEIAERIGVSRAALYYYFEDQEDLVFQCYRRSCEVMARRLNEAAHSGEDALCVLDRFLESMLGGAEAEFAALSEAAYLRPEQRGIIIGLYEAILSNIAEILETGARRGDMRPCGSRMVAQAILGVISWIPMARRWRTSDTVSDRDLLDAVRSLFREGVAADRAAPAPYQPHSLEPPGLPAGRVFDAEAMSAARQEALLAAASWLFNLKGVDATPLEEIALRVGVTKKVIYHNVGDKETLVIQCYRRAFRLYEALADQSQAYGGSRLEAICASTHALAEMSFREDIAPLAPLGGFEALPSPVRSEIQGSAERLMNGYLKLYRDGQAEGSVRPLDARALLSIHPGTFEWLPKWFEVLTPEERERAPRELAELTRIGLLPV
jgi:AcrR family transcriptional regulator